MEGVGGSNIHKHVVGQGDYFNEDEDAMLSSFDSRDVPRKTTQSRAEISAWLAEDPPVLTVSSAPIVVAFWFYSIVYPPTDLRKPLLDFCEVKAAEVDDEFLSRRARQVTTV